MRNIVLTIQYDGSRFDGWQKQGNTQNTLQGKFEAIFSRMTGEESELHGSGRTDAGVHAMGQIANFRTECQLPIREMMDYINRYLPRDAAVIDIREGTPRFHARLNAKTKTYRYRVWNSDVPCVFDRKFVYIHPKPVHLDSMVAAAQLFLGQHDFSAFCANKNMKKSTVRHIESFDICCSGNELVFTVTGNGFLHHMVRIMVGTLLEVGKGERTPDSIVQLFGAPRAQSGELIPSSGLCLMEVKY